MAFIRCIGKDSEPKNVSYQIMTISSGGSDASIEIKKYIDNKLVDAKVFIYTSSASTQTFYDLLLDYGTTTSQKWSIFSGYNKIGYNGTEYSYGELISQWTYDTSVDMTLSRIEPMDLQLKQWAYLDGHGVAFTLRDSDDSSFIFRTESMGELDITFYEKAYVNNKYIFRGANSEGPYIRIYENNIRVGINAGSSSNITAVSYSTGEHTAIINRFSDHKIFFDGNELSSTFSETSSGNHWYIGGVSTTSVSLAWSGYIKSITIKDKTTGEPMYSLKPCLFKNTPCFYDSANDEFYYYLGLQVMDEIPTT